MVVEHSTEGEPVARGGRKLAQAGEIAGSHRRRSLNFQPDDLPGPVLDDDVDLVQLLVAEVAQGEAVIGPVRSLEDFRIDEGFQYGTEMRAVRSKFLRRDASQRGKKT